MKALIDSNNNVIDVVAKEFEVHKSLTWMDCPNECKAGEWRLEDGILRAIEFSDPRTISDIRRSAYPNIGEQLDYIFHNGITKWKSDMIKPVKDKYPKG